jgi:hypothetical protein
MGIRFEGRKGDKGPKGESGPKGSPNPTKPQAGCNATNQLVKERIIRLCA